jgi:hypothetical protein
VRFGPLLLGDLGNPAVDARLLSALLLRGGLVAQWLQAQGIDRDGVRASFPDSEWSARADLAQRDRALRTQPFAD